MVRWMILILLVLPVASVQARMVDVYVLAGQSNMQGIGKVENLDPGVVKPVPKTYFWKGEAFVGLIPGKTSHRQGELGPEVTFAQTLAMNDATHDIYVIKYAASGQALHHGWSDQKWLGGEPAPKRDNFYPGKNSDDPNIGLHYSRLMTVCKNAFDYLKANNVNFTLKGIVWMQGEQDSKNKVSAVDYAFSLKRFKQRLEEDIGSGSVPFVYGQVLPHEPAMARFTHRAELRASMANADMNSGHAQSVPGAHMVSTDDMPCLADTVHFNAKGQAMLGQAFAEMIIQGE